MRDRNDRHGGGALNLLKLCVGAEDIADLANWQKRLFAQQRARGEAPRHLHVTRMWPRRAEELLNGGSLYWVIKGFILARQEILALEEVTGMDGTRRCAISLNKKIVRTDAAPRRPFQGWRYLHLEDAPHDLPGDAAREATLPVQLQAALADLGVR